MDDGSSQPGLFLLLNFIRWSDIFNPVDSVIVFGLLSILVLVVGSGIVSSAEVALFSLDNNQLKEMEESEVSLDKHILAHLNRPRRLLGTILMANNIFNISIVLVFYWVTQHWFNPAYFSTHKLLEFLLQVVMVTFFLVLFGEVLPKIYATHNNLGVSRFVITPLRVLTFFCGPFVKLLTKSTNYLEKRLEGKTKGVSAKDIDQAIDLTVDQDDHTTRNMKILKGIVKFGNINVTQVMRSRMDVIAIDKKATFDELLEVVRESGYSRIPVFDEDFDNVVGIIYAKDLLKHLRAKDNFDWNSLIRQPLFVPENKKIDDLLEEFQLKRVHLAIVVDEYGGSSGIVTLEDILEEVIGEINDEFDDIEEIDFQKIDDHNFIFDGKTPLNDLCKVLDYTMDYFDTVRGEADSIAGLFLEIKGEMPRVGEKVSFDNCTFSILEATPTRIIKVKVTLKH